MTGGQAGIAHVVGRARPHTRRLCFSSGCRLHAIGLGAIRFMLRGVSSPNVRSIAPSVLTHPDGRRALFQIGLRSELAGDPAKDRAECLPRVWFVRPVGHAHNMTETTWNILR